MLYKKVLMRDSYRSEVDPYGGRQPVFSICFQIAAHPGISECKFTRLMPDMTHIKLFTLGLKLNRESQSIHVVRREANLLWLLPPSTRAAQARTTTPCSGANHCSDFVLHVFRHTVVTAYKTKIASDASHINIC